MPDKLGDVLGVPPFKISSQILWPFAKDPVSPKNKGLLGQTALDG